MTTRSVKSQNGVLDKRLPELDLADLMPSSDRSWWYSQPWAEDWGPERRRAFLHAYLTKAPYEDGLPGPVLIPPSSLPWFDPTLAKRGRSVAESNLALLVSGIITALSFGRAFKNVSGLFLRHFHPGTYSLGRMASTMRAVLAYNIGDHEDPDSSFFVELNRVCEIHRTQVRSASAPKIPPEGLTFPPWYAEVIKAIQKDIEASDFPDVNLTSIMSWDPPLRFSQFDASVVGNILLIPVCMSVTKTGMTRKKEMDAVLHLTAIAGRGLGVKDDYNLGLVKDPGVLVGLCRLISISCLKDLEETNVYMMDSMLRGVQKGMVPLVKFPRTRMFLYFMLDLAGVKPRNLWALMSWKDKAAFLATTWFLHMFGNYAWFRVRANSVVRCLLKDLLG